RSRRTSAARLRNSRSRGARRIRTCRRSSPARAASPRCTRTSARSRCSTGSRPRSWPRSTRRRRRRPDDARAAPPARLSRAMTSARAAVVTLRPGREKSLRERHPWVYSGAIERVDGEPGAGDMVELRSHDGRFLAVGAWSPASQIRARAWSFASARIDDDFFVARVRAAVDARSGMLDAEHAACRLVHGESDGLPGVVADRYGDTVVVQLSSAGAERWRDAIVGALC